MSKYLLVTAAQGNARRERGLSASAKTPKRLRRLVSSATLTCALAVAQATPARAAGEQEAFIGVVTDQSGRAIADATVEVNGVKKQTSKDGAFELYAPRSNRYTINARKNGYGLASQIETNPYGNVNLRLVTPKAETYSINASVANTINDSSGTQIELPANSLVDSSGKAPTAPVNVSMYTYNLTTEAMPGDMGYTDANGAAGYLQSAGVFFVDISDASGGKKYNLAAGKQAKISLRATSLDPTVGLLSYAEGTGNWKEEGKAALVNGRYEGAVAHFTVWNFDWKKKDPACVKLTIDKSFFDKFQKGDQLTIQAKIVSASGQVVKTLSLGNSSNAVGNSPHVLYNLPPNATVYLYANGDPTPYATLSTGAPWGGTGVPPRPYDVCKGKATLAYPPSPEKPDNCK
jgi:hypothetical protein